MTRPNYLKDNNLDEKIIKLKKEGLTNKEIASRLGYAESTINMHIRQIKDKEKKK
jgi:DNA-binding CsgD family transcriptional regulator